MLLHQERKRKMDTFTILLLVSSLLWFYFLEIGLTVMSLEPGFLDFDNLPDTNFSCVGKVIGGYYADLETNCQMFHVCTIGQLDEPMDIRFLCLNGTVFDQETRVCERIDEVDCTKSEKFYSLNLELYGNTQPPLLEESPETEPVYPLHKPVTTSSTTTVSTTSPSTPTKSKSTSPSYFNSNPQTTIHSLSKEITSVHLPVGESSDIRFNPLEINVNLKPQAPPIIKTQIPRPVPFLHQNYANGNTHTKLTVTTPSSNKPHRVPLLPTVSHLTETSPKAEIMHPMINSHTGPTAQDIFDFINHHQHQNSHGPSPTEVNFGFTFHNTEPLHHSTENSNVNYHFHQTHVNGLRPPPLTSGEQYVHHQKNSNDYGNQYSQQTTSSAREKVSPSKRLSPNFHSFNTEKSQGLQLPLPALPHLHPLSFSSPAPFSLSPRIESKRYTTNNNAPRIVISARASVSDNNGRRLNYSLGTIGETELVGIPLPTYDEYKDEVDGLSYYEDDEKDSSNKKERSKRSIEDDIDDLIGNDDGVDVLKYLYDWYSKQEEATSVPSLIAEINYKLAPLDPEIAESRGEYSLKSANNPPARTTNSKRKPFVKDRKEIGAASTFNDDHSEEQFVSTFASPFGGYDSKHFDFARDNDHNFFDKDDQDSFEVFNDAPTDDDFPPNIGDVEEHIEKDDKNGRKYSYKKIVLSQASKDGDDEVPHGTSIVKNNKVISHETFSEFTNFTDYDDQEEPKNKQVSLPPQKGTSKFTTTTEIVKTRPETSTIPVAIPSTTIVTPPTTSTSTRSMSRQRQPAVTNNTRRRSRFRTTTRIPEGISSTTKRSRNAHRRTSSRYISTTTPRTTTKYIPTTTYKYENIEDDYDSDETYTLSPPSTTFATINPQNTTRKQLKATINFLTTDYPITTSETTTSVTTKRANISTTTTVPSHREITPLARSKVSHDIEKKIDAKLQKSQIIEDNFSEEEVTKENSEENERNYEDDISDANAISTTTVRTSLPLEDIFNYFVSTTKSSYDDQENNTTTESMKDFITSTEIPTTTQNVDYTQAVKSLVHDIELKTKSVVNEKDIENLTEINSTDTAITLTSLMPETSTFSTPSNRKKISRHRFTLTKEQSPEAQVPKVLTDLIQSVKQTLDTTTDNNNYITTYETTTERNIFDSSESLDNEQNHLSTPKTTDADSFSPTLSLFSDRMEDGDYQITSTEDTYSSLEASEEGSKTTLDYLASEEGSKTTLDYLRTFLSTTQATSTFKEDSESSTTEEVSTPTTEIIESTTTTKLPYRRRNSVKYSNHRFGFGNSNNSKRKPSYRTQTPSFGDSSSMFSRRRRPSYQKAKIDIVASYSENNTTERSRRNRNNVNGSVGLLTEQPLSKNVSPTQSKENNELHVVTTPYSKKKKARLRENVAGSFLCFQKDLNKFYSDPRDCRLFHYCTPGYSRSQIVDMKFVCDLGTYFDDQKLVCSKTKPSRCL